MDPGMSDAERAAVHQMYRDLAGEINQGFWAGDVELATAIREESGERYRLATEHLDLTVAEDGVYCVNLMTRELLVLSSPWRPVISWLADAGPVSLQDVAERLGTRSLAFSLLGQLSEHRLLVREVGCAAGLLRVDEAAETVGVQAGGIGC
jgi:hypothetical protein